MMHYALFILVCVWVLNWQIVTIFLDISYRSDHQLILYVKNESLTATANVSCSQWDVKVQKTESIPT